MPPVAGAKISASCLARPAPVVAVDQVIINLAVNARDAMPGGGTLAIHTGMADVAAPIQRGHEVIAPGRYVTIAVADSGVGIPKENIGRIFEPFFSTKEVGAGTGLGLSTVYGIVRQTGGYILIESAVGEGTAFTIYLPAQAEGTAAARHLQRVSPPEHDADLTGAGTILLVEDEDAVRLFSRGTQRGWCWRPTATRATWSTRRWPTAKRSI